MQVKICFLIKKMVIVKHIVSLGQLEALVLQRLAL